MRRTPAAALRDLWTGAWDLQRTIDDPSAPATLACAGSAWFTPAGDGVRYEERVTLALPRGPVHASRAYRYAFEGDDLVATFDDGTPFFRTTVDAALGGTARHRCGGDLYTGRFAAEPPDRWTFRWDVSGGKALTIVTRYRR